MTRAFALGSRHAFARSRSAFILRIGLEEFARGFRAGYFASATQLRVNNSAGDRATV